jgi:hypothetical protein
LYQRKSRPWAYGRWPGRKVPIGEGIIGRAVELWRYDPGWVSTAFLVVLMIVGYAVPEILERLAGWFAQSDQAASKGGWGVSLRMLVTAILVPVAVFVGLVAACGAAALPVFVHQAAPSLFRASLAASAVLLFLALRMKGMGFFMFPNKWASPKPC